MEALCGSGAEVVKGGSREEGGGEGRRVSVGELFSGTRSHCRAETDTGELPLERFLMLRKEEAWAVGQTAGQAEMAPQAKLRASPGVGPAGRAQHGGPRPSLCSRGPGRPVWRSLPLHGWWLGLCRPRRCCYRPASGKLVLLERAGHILGAWASLDPGGRRLQPSPSW